MWAYTVCTVKCFIEANISGVVFAHNLDLNAFVVFVLAGIDVFFFNRGIFVVDMFSYAIMVKRVVPPIHCSVISPATRELVRFISS